jgi:drug/metabolite transporter superfamily protein YnfA
MRPVGKKRLSPAIGRQEAGQGCDPSLADRRHPGGLDRDHGVESLGWLHSPYAFDPRCPGIRVAFFCLSLTLRTMSVGVAYAIWSGIGIVLISLIGWVFYRVALDLPAILGVGLILCGVPVVNLFSQSAGH